MVDFFGQRFQILIQFIYEITWYFPYWFILITYWSWAVAFTSILIWKLLTKHYQYVLLYQVWPARCCEGYSTAWGKEPTLKAADKCVEEVKEALEYPNSMALWWGQNSDFLKSSLCDWCSLFPRWFGDRHCMADNINNILNLMYNVIFWQEKHHKIRFFYKRNSLNVKCACNNT